MGKLVVAALFPLSLGVLAVIVGAATNYWQILEHEYDKYYAGLWKTCAETTFGSKTCTNFTEVEDWLVAVRALAILAILILTSAIMVTVVYIFKTDKKSLETLAFVLATIGGLCACFSAAVYAMNFRDSDSSDFMVSWSMFVTAGGGFISLMGGTMIQIDRCCL